ncbi:PQQ-binding-like beta-propeller repeat protein [Nonomuraea thailandensis]
MVRRRELLAGAVAAVALAGAGQSPAAAVTRRADRNFPKVGGNLANQNYTALRGLHRGNVRRLRAAWVNHIEGGLMAGNSQSTAVAVDGVLFVESALGNVVAVDGRTGATIWKYEQTRGAVTRRGVAVGDGRVYTCANDNWLIALDQRTGQVVWERQHNGYGNLEKVAVTYHDGMLYCGTNDGPRGAALAFDAATGDLAWHFWGTAAPGEIGGDTWEGDSWQVGGATPWMHCAIDAELGLVYWTFGNARGSKSSQDGSERGGQNLFANSIVAMDLKTGAYRWHFQSVHHDIWDMDNVMAPVLVDARVRGRQRKLVVYGSKTGMYYILDRADGSPRWASTRCPCRRSPGRRRGRRSRSRARAAGPSCGRWRSRWAPRCPACRTGPCRTTRSAPSTRRTGTSRSSPSPATAAAPTGTTSPTATAPAWCTRASATWPPPTR